MEEQFFIIETSLLEFPVMVIDIIVVFMSGKLNVNCIASTLSFCGRTYCSLVATFQLRGHAALRTSAFLLRLRAFELDTLCSYEHNITWSHIHGDCPMMVI